ncbi:MAG: prepilin-type N-terminal cleavage/methylation domain-containing protein [Acidobacteria bacterium]|nr:prepilin-type N-terminal cleavage/methylation domain-containing protein [Acidobacteriota bacterium]
MNSLTGKKIGSSGFTVIELMVVLTIIGILSAIGVNYHRKAIIQTKEAVLKEDLFQMRDALEQYYADKSRYPQDLETLVDEGYMRRIPADPITKSSDTWELIYEEPIDNDPDYEIGVYDIRSGSGKRALDGTIYNEW